jgi:hypothetical protein
MNGLAMSDDKASILFSISSVKHVLTMEPVVQHLKAVRPDLLCDVMSTAEFHRRRESDRQLLERVFDNSIIIDDHLPLSFSVLSTLAQYKHMGCRGSITITLYNHALELVRRLIRLFNFASTRRFINRIFLSGHVRCLVLANDRTYPVRFLAPWGAAYGIRSILIQESIRKDEIMVKTKGLSIKHERKGLNGQGGCDRIAAWGKSSLEYYKKVGVNPDQVVLTGNPRIDDLVADYDSLSRDGLRKTCGLPLDERVILFATNPLYKMKILTIDEYISSVQAVAKSFQSSTVNATLVIKPHQIEVEHQEWGLDQELDAMPRVHYLKDITLVEALALSDAVLIFNSTVAVEAALFQKPVGVINFTGVDQGVNFGEFDFAVELKDMATLQQFICGDYPPGWDFSGTQLDDFITNIGGAAEAIGREILDLAD